jgi:hypothetical protein
MKKKWLTYIIFGLVFGFLAANFRYLGFSEKISLGLKQIPFWSYPLLFIFSFYLTLSLHEFGHFFGFMFHGTKNRAIHITAFVLYKKNNHWRLGFNYRLFKLLGGFVVPDLNIIDSEETYQKEIQTFAKSLIIGPLSTIISMLMIIVIFLLVLIYSEKVFWIGSLFIVTIFSALLSYVYILSSKLHTDNIYGDFVAYKKMQEDELFQYVQISQYIGFSLKNHEKSENFLFNKCQELLIKHPLRNNMFYYTLLKEYLYGLIKNENPNINPKINEKLSLIRMSQLKRSVFGVDLLYMMSMFDYLTGDAYKAYQKYRQAVEVTIKGEEKMLDYLRKYAEHKMNYSNHEEVLRSLKNVDNLAWVFSYVDDKKELDLKKLPYQYMQTEIYCDYPSE